MAAPWAQTAGLDTPLVSGRLARGRHFSGVRRRASAVLRPRRFVVGSFPRAHRARRPSASAVSRRVVSTALAVKRITRILIRWGTQTTEAGGRASEGLLACSRLPRGGHPGTQARPGWVESGRLRLPRAGGASRAPWGRKGRAEVR